MVPSEDGVSPSSILLPVLGPGPGGRTPGTEGLGSNGIAIKEVPYTSETFGSPVLTRF